MFLIISYVFPPCATGAGAVMYNLCKYLPKEQYYVITAQEEFCIHLGIYDENFQLDCNIIRLPVRTTSLIDQFVFFTLAIIKGLLINKKNRVKCILTVHPYFNTVIAGYVLRKLTKIPIVVYMHDLFSEQKKGKVLYKLYEFVERKILSEASLILVMNKEYQQHYLSRGIRNTAIIPPTIDLTDMSETFLKIPQIPLSKSHITIVYTGSVYGPQEAAVVTFLEAAKKTSGIQVLFATPDGKGYIKDYLREMIKDVNVGFLPKAECRALQKMADILFLPLSYYSENTGEVNVAFPCKLLEYLVAGKAILAVVPRGSFVDSFVRKHEVGLVVNELSVEKIVDAINELKNKAIREKLAKNALQTARLFDNRIWSEKLHLLLNRVAGMHSK